MNKLQVQFQIIQIGVSAGVTENISEEILEGTHGRFTEEISV